MPMTTHINRNVDFTLNKRDEIREKEEEEEKNQKQRGEGNIASCQRGHFFLMSKVHERISC